MNKKHLILFKALVVAIGALITISDLILPGINKQSILSVFNLSIEIAVFAFISAIVLLNIKKINFQLKPLLYILYTIILTLLLHCLFIAIFNLNDGLLFAARILFLSLFLHTMGIALFWQKLITVIVVMYFMIRTIDTLDKTR